MHVTWHPVHYYYIISPPLEHQWVKKNAICEIRLPIAIIAYYYYYMYIESYLIIFHQTFCIIKPATIIAERYTMHEHFIELIKHSNTSFRLAHKFTNEWIVKCHSTADPRGSLGFESQTVKVESLPWTQYKYISM